MQQPPRPSAGLPPRLAAPVFIVVAALFLGTLGYLIKVSTAQVGSAFGRSALTQADGPTSAMGGTGTKAAPIAQTVVAQSGTGPMPGQPVQGIPAAGGTGGAAPSGGGPPGPIMAEVQQFRARLQRNPNDVAALIGLGKLELQAGMYAKAEAHFARAARVQPHDTEALYGEAVAARALGRRTEAIAAYRRLLELAPHDAHAPDAREALKTLGA